MVGRTGGLDLRHTGILLQVAFDRSVCDNHLEKTLFIKKYLVWEDRLLGISDFQQHFEC